MEIKLVTGVGDISLEAITGHFDVTTSKGELNVSELNGSISGATGNGKITALKSKGEITLRSGKGDICISDSKGIVNASSGNGDLDISRVVLEGASSFTTSRGTSMVVLGESLSGDINVSSSSGKAILNFNNFKMEGVFTMRVGKGAKINSPFKFDRSVEQTEPGNKQRWISKTTKVGKSTNNIRISTATGSIQIIKG
jgi:hypothetical protein